MSAVSIDDIAGALARSLGWMEQPAKTPLEDIISGGLAPADFTWQPTACFSVGNRYLLLHLLETRELPSIVGEAAKQLLKSDSKSAHIVVVGSEVEEEAENGVRVVPAAWAVGGIARECEDNGIGLFFLQAGAPVLVFPPGYKHPAQCQTGEETGHIPKWLYQKVTTLNSLSPHLKQAFNAFVKKYSAATKGKKVDYDDEVRILTKLAREIANGDPRLFIPIGQLDVLREYERQGSNKKARDHFFHTFNNLLMGYYILGSLKLPREPLSAVDDFISPESPRQEQRQKIAEWEALILPTSRRISTRGLSDLAMGSSTIRVNSERKYRKPKR